MERRFWDAGGVRRLGLGRYSAFAGVLLTAETVTPASVAVVISDSGLAAFRVEGEARRDPGADRWDSLVGSGRLAWYLKPADLHVVIGSVEFSGAWRQRVPFQLMLGGRAGGVRGYTASLSAGATRTVVRLEERWAIGRLTRHGSFGLSSPTVFPPTVFPPTALPASPLPAILYYLNRLLYAVRRKEPPSNLWNSSPILSSMRSRGLSPPRA